MNWTGIELLESSRIDSQVIITTAYQNMRSKHMNCNITDYLLKPFTFNRFQGSQQGTGKHRAAYNGATA